MSLPRYRPHRFGKTHDSRVDAVKAESRSTNRLVEVLHHYGIPMVGTTARCPIHDDVGPSLSFGGNNEGLWQCKGCGARGNVIGLVAAINGLNAAERDGYMKSIGILADIFMLPKPDGTAVTPAQQREMARRQAEREARAAALPASARMTRGQQVEAYRIFTGVLHDVAPSAEHDAAIWLDAVRGIPQKYQDIGRHWLLTEEDLHRANEEVVGLAENDQTLLLAAGIMAEDGTGRRQLNWTKDCVLLGHLASDGERLIGMTARYLDADAPIRYRAPRSGGYAVDGNILRPTPYPYGLPSLKIAQAACSPLLIVEGAVKAMGALKFGHPAIAMGQRPGFAPDEEGVVPDDGVQQRMLTQIMNHLESIGNVAIVPDYDQDTMKRDIGMRQAAGLATWLEHASTKVEARAVAMNDVETFGHEIADHVGAQSDGTWVKDFDEIRLGAEVG